MSDPLKSISIIIPTYNDAVFLKKCLFSIVAQSVLPHEVIIVDDGSTNDLANQICRLEEFSVLSIKFYKIKNSGPSKARNYGFKINKKVKRIARKSALSCKAKDKSIIILEDFSFDQPSTRSYNSFLSSFNLIDSKTVLVMSNSNRNILLSSRNLKNSRVVLASELNTYDVMNANKLMFTESSVSEIEKIFNN